MLVYYSLQVWAVAAWREFLWSRREGFGVGGGCGVGLRSFVTCDTPHCPQGTRELKFEHPNIRLISARGTAAWRRPDHLQHRVNDSWTFDVFGYGRFGFGTGRLEP